MPSRMKCSEQGFNVASVTLVPKCVCIVVVIESSEMLTVEKLYELRMIAVQLLAEERNKNRLLREALDTRERTIVELQTKINELMKVHCIRLLILSAFLTLIYGSRVHSGVRVCFIPEGTGG